MNKFQIRICTLYDFKLGHTTTEAFMNINKAFGEGSISLRCIQDLYKKFRSGNFEVEDKERPGRPPKDLEEEVLSMIDENPMISARSISKEVDIHHTTVCTILRKSGMILKMDKWVPHNLTENQKLRRLNTCYSLLSRYNLRPFLDQIITCDEKWINYEDIRRSKHWVKNDCPPIKVPKPDLHPKKVLFSVWWSTKGIIYHEFIKLGCTIDSELYCLQINKVHEQLKISHPAVMNRKGPIILQDNAKPHTSKITLKKFADMGFEILPHPAYSPDISPTDYHLFRSMSNYLAGKKFGSLADLKNGILEFLESKDPDFFESGIFNLVDRWKRIIENEGDYFD